MKPWILFDFNGTLLDDLDRGFMALQSLRKKSGLAPITFDWYRDHFTFPMEGFYRQMGFDFSTRSYQELTEDFVEAYHNSPDPFALFPDVVEVLVGLSDHYQLGVLSAYQHKRLEQRLDELEVSSFFAKIMGISDDLAGSKTHLLEDFLKQTESKPQHVVLIGDTLHDWEVAQSYKVNSLLVESGHQSFKQLKKAQPTPILKNLKECMEFIKENHETLFSLNSPTA